MTIKTWKERLADLPSGYHSNAKPHYMQTEIDELRAALEAALKDRVALAIELERLTTLSRGQHVELYNARLTLERLTSGDVELRTELARKTVERDMAITMAITSLQT